MLIKIRWISESRANRELSRNCECTSDVHESEPGLLSNIINLNNLCVRHREVQNEVLSVHVREIRSYL